MKKYGLIILGLTLILFTGCKESNGDYSDVMYITGMLESTNIRMPFEGPTSMGLTVTSTAQMDAPVTATFIAAPELLDAYNDQEDASYVAPPSDSYSLEDATVTIESGQYVSTQAKLSIADPSMFEEGKNYCLPVKLVSEDGNVLQSASTAYIVFVPIITTKVADISGLYYTIPKWEHNEDVGHLSQLTMECKVYVNDFCHYNPYISTLMGCEENFLLRFGDVSCDPDQLQLSGGITGGSWDTASGGTKHPVTYPQHFPTGKWFHFACVYDGAHIRMYLDGKQIGDDVAATGTITLAWSYAYWESDGCAPFAIGMSYRGRMLNGRISEFRVWDVARTPADLLNNICYVDPTTPGLLAYWRFNGEDVQEDGTIRDQTGHGYDAVPSSGTPRWVENHKCPY